MEIVLLSVRRGTRMMPPPDHPADGRTSVSVVPALALLSIDTEPRCSSTIRWHSARPSPVLPGLVDTNISNTCGRTSAGIGGPSLRSRHLHSPLGSLVEESDRSLPSGAASTALA